MKKKLIIINTIVVFSSLFLMLMVSCIFVVVNNQNNARIKLNEYLQMTTRLYDGTNASKTVETLFSEESNIRITIIDKDGNVLADSSKSSIETNHLNRPEIKDLNTIYTRYSDTLGLNMLYLACEDNNAYVRVSIPEAKVDSEVFELLGFGSLALVVILGFSILIILYYNKRTFAPLNLQIMRFSDLTGINISSESTDEEKLARSFDRVHDLIEDKISEIKEERNKLLFVINHIKQGFILIGRDKEVKLINNEALELFGFKDQDFINKNYIYLIRHRDIQLKIEDEFTNKNDIEFDFSINNKFYKLFMTYQSGNICMFIVDNTHDHKMNLMKKEFFDNASHELKSPLTTIIGYQQLINQKIITDPKEIDEATVHTIKEANRMNKIIIEMLELSKLESEVEAPNIEKTMIKDVVNMCLDSKLKQIEEKHITVNTLMDDSTIFISSNDLNHLLLNLIDNAIIYNKDNGTLKISVQEKVIEIEDSGIGIKPENLDRIFERFYRVDKAKSKDEGGTGLGLAIVKHICLLYGYDIKVESKYGSGTKFTITCK